ncbi:MAG: hypothetical protein GXO26_08985 [Crenarchaeota archaeon]|nr:hypothetical protein [Thermoproteota archaeon]
MSSDRVCIYVHAPNPIHYVLSVRIHPLAVTYGVGFWLRIAVTRSTWQICHGLADPGDILPTNVEKTYIYFYKIVREVRPECLPMHKAKPIALIFSKPEKIGNIYYVTNIEKPELTYWKILEERSVEPRRARSLGLTLHDVAEIADRLGRELHRAVRYVAWLVGDYVWKYMLLIPEPYYAKHNLVTVYLEHDYSELPYIPILELKDRRIRIFDTADHVKNLEAVDHEFKIRGDIYWQHTTLRRKISITCRGGVLSWRDGDHVYCLIRATEKTPASLIDYETRKPIGEIYRHILLRLRV